MLRLEIIHVAALCVYVINVLVSGVLYKPINLHHHLQPTRKSADSKHLLRVCVCVYIFHITYMLPAPPYAIHITL